MKASRRPKLRVAVVTGALLVPGLAPLACSDESRVGLGRECFVASDCVPGLVCVPQRGGSRLCSNDLSQVVGRPPPEAGGGDAAEAGDAAEDGTATDAPAQETSPPMDSGSG